MKNNFTSSVRGLARGAMMLLGCMILSGGLSAQSGAGFTVSGKVTSENGAPVAGASVVIQGTTIGVSAGSDGAFSINVPASAAGRPGLSLTVESLGFTPFTAPISPATPVLNVVLHERAQAIDDIVLIGYGTTRRGDLTTAISTVSTKDLDTRPVTSAAGIIQGKAAGVTAISPSGQPGSGMIIRVRGNSSLASSNDPLYVVDGIPVGEGNYAISFLSPNDIESMSVLKDASSSAIYGSRGANGVVLITTRNGSKSREPKISFSSFVGVSKVAKSFDVLNVAQYKNLMDETGYVTLPDGLRDETDWFKETYSTGINQNYQLSYAGSTERTSYAVSGGYSDEQGVLDVAYSKRYNFKANFDTRLRKWISFSTNILYSNYKTNDVITGLGPNRAGVVTSVISTPTYAKVWDPANPQWYWTNFYGANLTTPIENMGRTEYNYNTTDRLLGTLGATLYLARGLEFKSTVSMDRRWVHAFQFLDPVRTSYGRTQKGSATDARTDDRRFVFDNLLTYKFSCRDHNLDVLGGTSSTVSHWEDLSGTRTHFSSDYNNAIIGLNGGNNGGVRGQSAGVSEWTIMSYIARASYNYAGKYLITGNFRADGSSKLAPHSRWGYFPSFSGAWRLSSENFMKDIAWLDDLKIRASWGQTGNQSGLTDYAYMQLYNINYYDWTDPQYANAVPTVGGRTNLRNADLTWETTTQTDLGIDLAVLGNRLKFTFDVYYKYTTGMLMTVELPNQPSIVRNEADMSNKGMEFSISSHNLVREFKWDTDFNISFNRNLLEKLTLRPVYFYGNVSDGISENIIRMEAGKPLSMFYGRIAQGVDPETGDMIYADLNNNGVGGDANDRTWIGNPNPKFTFGMTNNFNYKGFNLSCLITGSYGNDIYNISKVEMQGMYTPANQTTDVLRRWQIPGQITDIPRAGNIDNIKNSTRWIEDGSYLKVKNITLSYDFNVSKLHKWNISRIQPYVSLENMFTITNYSGYDPEVSQYDYSYQQGIDWGTYPHVKTVVFGVNIDF